MKTIHYLSVRAIVVILSLLLAACQDSLYSPEALGLPQGDKELGQLVYTQFECAECHTLYDDEDSAERTIAVELGGKSRRVTSYAGLVSSVINPSHKLAKGYEMAVIANGKESKMRNYNDVMTITELVHLITYLKAHYYLEDIPVMTYPDYHY